MLYDWSKLEIEHSTNNGTLPVLNNELWLLELNYLRGDVWPPFQLGFGRRGQGSTLLLHLRVIALKGVVNRTLLTLFFQSLVRQLCSSQMI